MSQPREEPQQENRSSGTKGEEVWRTMYSKLVEEKNQVAETNQMYMKMLEACAEQNNLAERQATQHKKLAEEAQTLALEADEQRKESVIRLQQLETDTSAKIQEIEAKCASQVAEFASQLEQTQAANNTSTSHLNSEVGRLTAANLELRRELAIANSTSSSIPRQLTHKANEVRSDMAKQLAAAKDEVLEAEQRAKNEAKQAVAASKANEKVVSALNTEISELKASVLEEQRRRQDAEQKVIDTAERAQAAVQAQVQETQAAKDQAAQVQGKLEVIMNNAQTELDKQAAQYGQQIRALEQAKSEQETKFSATIATLTEQFSTSQAALTANNAQLQKELDEAKNKVAETMTQLVEANASVQKATRNKNQALKELREKMIEDGQLIKDQLAARTTELKEAQKQIKEGLDAVKAAEAKAAQAARTGVESVERQHGAEDSAAAIQKQLVEAEAKIAALQAELVGKDSELLKVQESANRDAELLKSSSLMAADRMSAVAAKHQEEVASLQAGLTQQINQISAAASTKSTEMDAELKRLQEVVSLNSEAVQQATKTKTALAEAESKIATLEGQLAQKGGEGAEESNESPVGKKRRRK